MRKQAGGRAARKMKPVILVLCEGKTEECYVDCLKQKYRLPIRVVSKVVGQKISPELINRYKDEMRLCKSEQIGCFLLYDADVPEIAERIAACTGATAILSRPCLEVWFLAHTEKVPAADLSAAECLRRLTRTEEWKGYRKGFFLKVRKNSCGINGLKRCAISPSHPLQAPPFQTYRNLSGLWNTTAKKTKTETGDEEITGYCRICR